MAVVRLQLPCGKSQCCRYKRAKTCIKFTVLSFFLRTQVLAAMKAALVSQQGAAGSNSFLLDDQAQTLAFSFSEGADLADDRVRCLRACRVLAVLAACFTRSFSVLRGHCHICIPCPLHMRRVRWSCTCCIIGGPLPCISRLGVGIVRPPPHAI